MDKDAILLLVAKAKQGDQEAFGILYEEYLTPVYRFIYFHVRHKNEAEDIAQNVFVRALGAIARYEEQGTAFSTWLYTIARNLIIDYWKKKPDVLVEDPALTLGNIPDEHASADRSSSQRESASLV